MMMEGEWQPFGLTAEEQERGATIRCGPVFYGTVSRFYSAEAGRFLYRAHLDGDCAAYPTMEKAKARVEWEIRNRVRQMLPGYQKILARQSTSDPANGA